MVDPSKSIMIKNSCDFVTNSVRDSCLNYSIQETPYSLYLTVRNTFTRSTPDAVKNSLNVLKSSYHDEKDKEIDTLKRNLKAAQDSNDVLTNDLREAVDESEKWNLQIKELKITVNNLHGKMLTKKKLKEL